HLVLLLQQLVAAAQLPQLGGLGRGDTRPGALLDIGQLQPAVQAGLRDAEIAGDLRQRRLALAGNSDHVTAELNRERLGHADHPSSEEQSSQARSQLSWGQSPSQTLAFVD